MSESIDIWEAANRGYIDPSPTCGWTIFYDETNNSRKLTLNADGDLFVNDGRALFHDFILGGVAVPDVIWIEIDDLKAELNIPSNVELKSKSFFKTNDFVYDFGGKRIKTLLKWIIDQGLFIHFYCFDSVYDAVIEVVDESIDTVGGRAVMIYHREMKDQMYELVMEHLCEFLHILDKYGYPRINSIDRFRFCQEIVSLIQANISDDNLYLEILKHNLKSASKKDADCIFGIEDSKTIISDYSRVYWYCMMNAPAAHHIFDHEFYVERKMSSMELLSQGKPCNTFEFRDSKEISLIQVSDGVVGMLSKVFGWIDYSTDDQIEVMSEDANFPLESFYMLNALIDRTNNYCPYLITNYVATSKTSRRFAVIDMLANKYLKISKVDSF